MLRSSHELFTPDGHAPVLADLKLETLNAPEQLEAVRAVLSSIALEKVFDDIRATFQQRSSDHADWGTEKPTHFVHLLGQATDDPYSAKVWLHQYKQLDVGNEPRELIHSRRVFTELDHTHRDGMVSLLLHAGYRAQERRYSRMSPTAITDRDTAWTDFYHELEPRSGEYERGDIMTIHPDEVHRLDKVLPGTLSLAVRLPVVRNFSVVFEGDDGTNPRIKADMATNRNNLLDDLEHGL